MHEYLHATKSFQEERARGKALTEELTNNQKKEFENFMAEQKVFKV
jgi:hypothetical protein